MKPKPDLDKYLSQTETPAPVKPARLASLSKNTVTVRLTDDDFAKLRQVTALEQLRTGKKVSQQLYLENLIRDHLKKNAPALSAQLGQFKPESRLVTAV